MLEQVIGRRVKGFCYPGGADTKVACQNSLRTPGTSMREQWPARLPMPTRLELLRTSITTARGLDPWETAVL